MEKVLAEKRLHNQSKVSNFRRWKAGKHWLYAASILGLMAGGGTIVGQVGLTNVHADTVPTTQTIISSNTSSMASDVVAAASSSSTSQASQASGPMSSVAMGADITNVLTSSTAAVQATSTAVVIATSSTVAQSGDLSVAASLMGMDRNDTVSSATVDVTRSLGSVQTSPTVSAGQFDNLVNSTSQADLALAAVSSTASTTSSAVSSSSLVAPDLSAIATSIGVAYNETLSGVITQLIGSAGVSNAVALLTNVVSQAGSFFSGVPGVSNVVTVANGVLNGVTQAINLANGLGIDPSGLVVTAITNGINGLGQAALAALTPVINNIPVIGSGLLSVVKPILSNLSNVSPSLVVSTLASATGLGGVLSTVSNIAASVAPQVINAVQGILNTTVSVINGVKGFINNAMNVVAPILQPIENVINGLVTPIQTILSNIVSSIKNALFPGGSSSAATSSSVTSNASSSANSATSSSHSSAVSVTPVLVTKELTIMKGHSWSALKNFVSATGSNGQDVALANITTQGTVNTQVPGVYYVMFQFIDSVTGKSVQSVAPVTIQQPDLVAESSAASAVAVASSAVAQDIIAVSAATSAINALPHSTSNLTSLFPATSNYPSSQVVYLSAASSAATPDVTALGSDVMQYVNDLRSANGQPALTYSISEATFAQTRAQQIITDFSHDSASGSTEDIGANRDVTSKMLSTQEMAYYMVMDWYDESDNPEAIGNGHYGHRANLLFGGPTMGVGFVRSSDPATKFTDYYAFEAPTYKDVTLYNQAIAMANATSNPSTIPLPNITFVYVDSHDFDLLYNKLTQLQQQLASDQAALAVAKNTLMTV